MRVARADDAHARLDRQPHVGAGQVEPVGEAVDLERDAVSRARTAIVRSRSRAFSGRCPISRPVGWLRQRTAGCRIASVTRAVSSRRGARWPRCSESCTQSSSASTSSGASRLPSSRMSHSTPRRILNGASALVGGGDLLGLPAQGVAVQSGDDADVRRVVADGQVLVAAVAGGDAHLEHGRPAVRPLRVHVQVAAQVAPSSTSCGGACSSVPSRISGGGTARPRRP